MPYLTFQQYVHRRDEGTWLPNQPIVASMGKVNPFPVNQTRLNRIVLPQVKPPGPVKPAVPAVPKSTPKLVPSPISHYIKTMSRVFEAEVK